MTQMSHMDQTESSSWTGGEDGEEVGSDPKTVWSEQREESYVV